jgi:hypothetical protein
MSAGGTLAKISNLNLGPGVRLARAASPSEVEALIGSLPRFSPDGIALDLDLRGEAHRYDPENQRVHYFRKESRAVSLWTWSPIGSYWEAAILRSLIQSRTEPLSGESAMQVLLRATNRRAEFLVPARQRPRPTQNREWLQAAIFMALLRVARLWMQRRMGRSRKLYSPT